MRRSAACPPEQLGELLEINRAIAAATDYDALPGLVVERTAEFLQAEQCMLLLADDDSRAIIAASVGVEPARARAFSGVMDERIGLDLCRLMRCDPQLFLAAPVIEKRQVRGMLVVHRREAEREADVFVLSALADQAAIALAQLEHRRRMVQAMAALQEADRRKDDFLAILSHELRNPLTPVSNSLYILKRTRQESDQARRALEIIDRQIAHLTRLVGDLLDVTRVTSGKLSLRLEDLDLAELTARTIDDHRGLMANAGLELHLNLPPEPVVVRGDVARVRQMLGNLLQNAIKFTDRGGRVRVSLRMGSAGAAVLEVRDTGIGIDRAMLRRIFEPFAQAEQGLERSAGGLGLGLALVKALADLQGGEVSAESRGPGTGTTLTLRFPTVAVRTAPCETVPDSTSGVPSRRVLIIEDNPDSAESLREVIELMGGHEVAVEHDGAAGVARALDFRPDVVLCDIGLPGMDGFEVARRLRAEQALSGCTLVALSGYALEDDVALATEAGFDRHLAKPADMKQVGAILERPESSE